LDRKVNHLVGFLNVNTEDWSVKFTGTEEHTPELCRLLNELQDEMERAGHRSGRFKFTAAYRKRQATNPE
jgi:hypothetical protein